LQAATQAQSETATSSRVRREVKRLTPMDYSKIGILKPYDWSVKEREAHDRVMEKYRRYLMKLCALSHETEETANAESE
jgi:hypothetical protein